MAPSTVVVQSFRTYDVPQWIQDCTKTVRDWAALSGFSYQFSGDEFLALAPEWYRQKAGASITVVTDLARLLLIRNALQAGFECAVWMDIDVLIFNAQRLTVDTEIPFGYSQQAWLEKGDLYPAINNSVCLFRNQRESLAHLEEYIDACLSIMKALPQVEDHTEVGTKYLTARHRQSPLPILKGFGLLSPAIMEAVLQEDDATIARFVAAQGGPIYAANLCNFFRSPKEGFSKVPDSTFSAVVQELIRTNGSCFWDGLHE
jgi:hypothetical protein